MVSNDLDLLRQGTTEWNKWRGENKEKRPDLWKADLRGLNLQGINLAEADAMGADLSESNIRNGNLTRAKLSGAQLRDADLSYANVSNADLTEAKLMEAKLCGTDLTKTDLREAEMNGADLREAKLWRSNLMGVNLSSGNLTGADIRGANLTRANLTKATLAQTNLAKADLTEANLTEARLNKADLRGAKLYMTDLKEARLYGADLGEADLTGSRLLKTDLKHANLTGSRIYGISAWDIEVDIETNQSDLVITHPYQSNITVDDLEVAQFVYLLIGNEKISHIIDTVSSKLVLILGRFTPMRKRLLDAIREELRKHDYVPVLFDFEVPSRRDTQETVSTLAHLARFILADITDPSSIPQELVTIVKDLPSVPIQPLLKRGSAPWGMYEHISRFPWVLAIHEYDDDDKLLGFLEEGKLLAPIEAVIQNSQSPKCDDQDSESMV
jgi:uncharacterized protein YjbI with pentapeptide repeats